MIRSGTRNSITDVAGIKVGNAEDKKVRSGVTVILPDEPVTAAVDVRGGGPGTRETDALNPACVVEAIHALVLSGGSAYGLDAASGMMSWLRARGRGLHVGEALVPIVPSAIIFDLLSGGDKDWGKNLLIVTWRSRRRMLCPSILLSATPGRGLAHVRERSKAVWEPHHS